MLVLTAHTTILKVYWVASMACLAFICLTPHLRAFLSCKAPQLIVDPTTEKLSTKWSEQSLGTPNVFRACLWPVNFVSFKYFALDIWYFLGSLETLQR